VARRFNGTSDFIVFTLPSTLEAVTAGSTTIVFVANFTNATDGAMVHARTSGGTNSWWMETFTEWNYGQGTTAKDVGDITTGSWAAYIGRKTTGGANAPRGRKIIFGGATTDVTAGTGLADGTAPGSGGILQVGKWGTASEFISADVAAVAVFNSDLSDGTTATFTTWQAILDASPVWAVHFDQANAADAITDATGNGGNSSSITGTTIVANPTDFFDSVTNLNAGNAATAVAANNASLAVSTPAGNAATAVAANAATLAVSIPATHAALSVGAFDASLTVGSALDAGSAATAIAASDAALQVGVPATHAATSVAANAATLTVSITSGHGAVAVGAFDATLTSTGATNLSADGAIIGVGAFDATISGTVVVTVPGSWQGLKAILDEIREVYAEERTAPPVACPRCGEPLYSARGSLRCRYDGWSTSDLTL
jgi:hypothetical protein